MIVYNKNSTIALLRQYYFSQRMCEQYLWQLLRKISLHIISLVMHALWLVLTYDLLEDRRIDDVIKTFFNSLLYKTNRFQVAVLLFSNRSQMTSKCGKNKRVAHEARPSVSLTLLLNIYRFENIHEFRRQWVNRCPSWQEDDVYKPTGHQYCEKTSTTQIADLIKI